MTTPGERLKRTKREENSRKCVLPEAMEVADMAVAETEIATITVIETVVIGMAVDETAVAEMTDPHTEADVTMTEETSKVTTDENTTKRVMNL